MGTTSRGEYAKIRALKREISQTESFYSDKINSLRQKELQLRHKPTSTGLLTPKLVAKQEQKWQEVKDELSSLEKERNQKIKKLKEELSLLKYDYRENYGEYKKAEIKEKKEKIQNTKKDMKIFLDQHKYVVIGSSVIILFIIIANIVSAISNNIKIAAEEGRDYYINVGKEFTYDCNAKYDGGFSAYCEDRYIDGSFSNYETVYFSWGTDMEINGNSFTKKIYDYVDPSIYQKNDFDIQSLKDGMDKKHYFDLRNNVLDRIVASETVTVHYNLSESDLALISQLHEKWAEEEAEKAAQAQREAEEQAKKEAEEQAAKAEAERKAAEEEARRAEEEQRKNEASDDPTQIPEDDIYDAIAACMDVLEDTYGVKVKMSNYSDGYWSGRDYEWTVVFRNGKGYNVVTCSYNWKTGGTVAKYIN